MLWGIRRTVITSCSVDMTLFHTIEMHCSVYASVEELGHDHPFMLATDLCENHKEAVSANQVK